MKYIKYIGYVLMAICVLVLIYFLIAGEGAVNLMLTWAYILLGLAILVAVVFPLIDIITNPKGAIRSLLGLAVIAVVLVVTWMLASDATIITPVKTFDNTFALKFTDMGLYTMYIAMGAALLAVFFGEIRSLFK